MQAPLAARACALASALASWGAGGSNAARSIASHCNRGDAAIASTSSSSSTIWDAGTRLQQFQLFDLNGLVASSTSAAASWQQQRGDLASGASLALQALEQCRGVCVCVVRVLGAFGLV